MLGPHIFTLWRADSSKVGSSVIGNATGQMDHEVNRPTLVGRELDRRVEVWDPFPVPLEHTEPVSVNGVTACQELLV